MKTPPNNDQPAFDIWRFKEGHEYSMLMNSKELTYHMGYTKPYKAGRIAGINENNLTQLLKGVINA